MRARKIDTNQHQIVEWLEEYGCRVHKTNADWDLSVQLFGLTMLCEVRPETGGIQKARQGNQERVHGLFSIYWLRNQEDCKRLVETLLSWHKAICAGCAVGESTDHITII